jgi:hypothetical protein
LVGSVTFRAIAVTVVSLPAGWAIQPVTPGLDHGWVASLHLVFAAHLPYGSRFVFTYGPLGFLTTSGLYTRGTAIAALAYALAVDWLLAIVVLRALDRAVGRLVSTLAAYAAVSASLLIVLIAGLGLAELGLLLLVAAAIEVWTVDAGPGRMGWSEGVPLVGLGVGAGVLPLVKLSVGVVALLIGACAIVGVQPARRLRSAAVSLPVALAVFAAGWFGTGNGTGNMVAYLRTSYSVISGYAQAMATNDASSLAFVVVALLVASVVAAAAPLARELQVRQRAALFVAVGLTILALLREGYVREDSGHQAIFGAGALLLVAILAPRRSPSLRTGLLLVVAVPLAEVTTISQLDWLPVQPVYLEVGVVLAVALLALVVTVALLPGEHPRRARALWLGVAALTLVVVAYADHQELLAGDANHLVPFAVAALLLSVWARGPGRALTSSRGRTVALAVIGATALLLATTALPELDTSSISLGYQPLAAVAGLADAVRTLVSPDDSARYVAQERSALTRDYRIPASMLQIASGATAFVEPSEQNVLFAYPQLHYDPFPVAQDYVAYTASLDQLDVSFIDSAAAPRFVFEESLREVAYFPQVPFAAPAARVAVECHYRQAAEDPKWQLLVRVPDRCGTLHRLAVVRATYGAPVAVPDAPPDDAVVATFALSIPLAWTVENALFKPPALSMSQDRTSFQFVVGNAGDLHLLRQPADLGYAPAYALPSNDNALALYWVNGGDSSGEYSVTFYSMAMQP